MANDVWVADSVQIWLKNGNERAMKLIRSWEESEFQSTLAAQHSKDYKMELEQYAAALGTRGDYFMIKVPLTTTSLGASTATPVNGHLYIDFIDIMGVAADVQLGKVHGYGKYSPFDSADLKVTDEMKVGVESEHLAIVLNQTAVTTTYVSQNVHGDSDDRIQGRFETAPTTLIDNEFWLRLKPTASNVFLMRYDSKIWVLPADNTTTNAFYET
jgi:hypothetical protein